LSKDELEACGAPVYDKHFSSIFKCISGADGLLAKDEFAGSFDGGNKKCFEAARNGQKDHDSNSVEEDEEKKH